LLSCSEIDHTFDTQSRRRAIDILREIKTPYQVQLFSGVEHGFALRGNMENPWERECYYLFVFDLSWYRVALTCWQAK